jgi:thymidylate kinase
VFHPSGLTIAFLGPDGCGKSSVIAAVSQEMAAAFRSVHCVHLRPRVIGGGRSGEPVSEPHAMPPRGVFASTAKLGWFLFDYWSGYLLSIWPRRMRSTLVIFDRYYHDITVDPLRYRYGGPMLLARLAGWLVPKPDIWFVLDAPAEVVWARKSEVDLVETQRQREAYLALLNRLRGVAVDVSRELPDVVRQVEIEILDHLERRTARRWHCPSHAVVDRTDAGSVAGATESIAGVACGNERHGSV